MIAKKELQILTLPLKAGRVGRSEKCECVCVRINFDFIDNR